jgi:hypothetical protein
MKEGLMDGAYSMNGRNGKSYNIFIGKPGEKRSLGKPRRRWKDNIKIIKRV